MKIAAYKLLAGIQLTGVFVTTALLMAVYEFLKEIFFKGALNLWGAHAYTVIATATVATIASAFVRKWAVNINDQLRIAATAFESQEAILVTDANSVIMRVNRAFTDITGYASWEIVGRTPNVLSSGRQDANFYASMWETINNTDSWEGEIWNRRKNGEIYFQRSLPVSRRIIEAGRHRLESGQRSRSQYAALLRSANADEH
jgi:PAS domain S-box-containing protein